MAELEIFASFVLFASGDGGSVGHIERSVVGVGDAVSPSGRPRMGSSREIRDKFWEIGLTFDSWSPASGGNDGRRYEGKGRREEM